MKKYILIAGVPRAGKSTASQLLAKRLGCPHISMDSILAGIEKALPEAGIQTDAPIPPEDNLAAISAKVAPFIRAMMDSGEYDEYDCRVVIDVYQLLPKDYAACLAGHNCEIHYLLSSDVSPEERYAILKAHDTPRDYTYHHSDEDNRQNCADIVYISQLMKAQCQQYSLPFYETSRSRQQVLQALVDAICREN